MVNRSFPFILIIEDSGTIYSDYDYGCAWAGGRPDKPLPREAIRAALEMGANIALYAYQREHNYKLRTKGPK